MREFFSRWFTASGSSSQAKNRLHFVLVQDRAGLSSDDISKFKRELIDVIGKYFEIDERAFDISYKRELETTTLQINSTVAKRKASKRLVDSLEREVVTTSSPNSAVEMGI
jgi:cell division topological specificity factor